MPLHVKKIGVLPGILAFALCMGMTAPCVYAVTPDRQSDRIISSVRQSDAPEKSATDTKKSNVLTSKEVDEIVLSLIKKSWKWEWIRPLAPYMTYQGRSKIVPESQTSSWANQPLQTWVSDGKGGWLLETTGVIKPFTQTQVDEAVDAAPANQMLTRADLDKHAFFIWQDHANESCLEILVPYMTDAGLSRLTKSGYLPKLSNMLSNADKQALYRIQTSGTWDAALERFFPYMSKSGVAQVVSIYLDNRLNANTTYDSAKKTQAIISSAFPYMSKEDVYQVKTRLAQFPK